MNIENFAGTHEAPVITERAARRPHYLLVLTAASALWGAGTLLGCTMEDEVFNEGDERSDVAALPGPVACYNEASAQREDSDSAMALCARSKSAGAVDCFLAASKQFNAPVAIQLCARATSIKPYQCVGFLPTEGGVEISLCGQAENYGPGICYLKYSYLSDVDVVALCKQAPSEQSASLCFEKAREGGLYKDTSLRLCARATSDVAPYNCYTAAMRGGSHNGESATQLCARAAISYGPIDCYTQATESITALDGNQKHDTATRLCAGAESNTAVDCYVEAINLGEQPSTSVALCEQAKSIAPVDCFTTAKAQGRSREDAIALCAQAQSNAPLDCFASARAENHSVASAVQLCENSLLD